PPPSLPSPLPSPSSAALSTYASRHVLWSTPTTTACDQQFGNGYSTIIPICSAPELTVNQRDRERAASGNSRYVCYHNENTHATHCDVHNLM
ncbi:hypothetical protein ACH0C8_15880, partial [Acetobacter lovaniensis]|uniref:hypothetical protein n=1 Tax=Acetobacter lovaniensis TaxID=104100 RepID=UPI00376FC62B